MASASRDVTFDFEFRLFDILRQTSDFEDRLLVSTRCDDVGVRRLLDTFDRRSFRSHHQTNDTIRNPNLNGGLLRRENEVIQMQIRVTAAANAAIRRTARAILLLAC